MSACKYVLQAKICFRLDLYKITILKEAEQDIFYDQIPSLTVSVRDPETGTVPKQGWL